MKNLFLIKAGTNWELYEPAISSKDSCKSSLVKSWDAATSALQVKFISDTEFECDIIPIVIPSKHTKISSFQSNCGVRIWEDPNGELLIIGESDVRDNAAIIGFGVPVKKDESITFFVKNDIFSAYSSQNILALHKPSVQNTCKFP